MRFRINNSTVATIQPASDFPEGLRIFPFIVSLEIAPKDVRLGRGKNATTRAMPASTAVVAAFEQEIDAKLYIIRVLKGTEIEQGQ